MGTSLKTSSLPFSLLPEGIPQGALTEISGPVGGGKTETVIRLLAENPALRVAWVEEEFTAYPPAFMAGFKSVFPMVSANRCSEATRGLDRFLFVETSEYLWAVQQILRSQIFGVVVLSAEIQGEIELRRLQLAAEKSRVTVIILTELPTQAGAWPIAVQISVSRSAEQKNPPHLTLLKYRGQRLWHSKTHLA